METHITQRHTAFGQCTNLFIAFLSDSALGEHDAKPSR
jgi:hypothetical protein